MPNYHRKRIQIKPKLVKSSIKYQYTYTFNRMQVAVIEDALTEAKARLFCSDCHELTAENKKQIKTIEKIQEILDSIVYKGGAV